MQFSCNREQLVQAVAAVERAVPSRDVQETLKGILLEAEGDGLKLTAYDMELGMERHMPADVMRSGAVIVDARLFTQLVRRLPGDTVSFTYETDGNTASVRSGRADFSIHTRRGDEFPRLPDTVDGTEWRIDQAQLRQMIRQTVFAAAVDDHRSYLNGLLFEVQDAELRLVATDTNRLAFRKGFLAEAAPEQQRIIVPARAARELARLLVDEEDEFVDIVLAENQITFRLDSTRVVSRLLEGRFPNYEQVLPHDQPIQFHADREVFAAAVERASVLSRQGPAVVITDVGANTLTLSAREADVGQSQEIIDVVQTGEDGKNSYQARFILDVLRAFEDEKVQMTFAEGDVPATLKPVDGDDYVCLVMPVRLR